MTQNLPYRLRIPGIAADSPPPAPSFEELVWAAHNRERRALGLPAFTRDRRLDLVARLRVADMVIEGYFGHDDATDDPARIDGKYHDILPAAGVTAWRFAGENLWQGSPGWKEADIPGRVVQAFLASPTHRANALDPGYDAMGCHLARRPDGWMVCACIYTEGANT
jgi:uncharacterized protein YkwD